MKSTFKTLTLLTFALMLSWNLCAQDELPELKGWLDDKYYLEQRYDEEGNPQLWKVNAKTGRDKLYQEKLPKDMLAEKIPAEFSVTGSYIHTEDHEKAIFNKEQDLYYWNGEEMLRLTNDEDEEMNATFSPDESKIAFTKNNNLFVIDLESGTETQLTFDGSDLILNGYSSWVYWEEIHGRATNYKTFWWAPNSEMIAYERFDDEPVPEFMVYNPDGVRGEWEKQRYPKAGDPNPGVKLGVIDLQDGETIWIADNSEKDVYIAFPMWTKDSEYLLYQKLNRDQDHLEIYKADPKTGEKQEIYDEEQKTWIDFFEDIYLLEDGSGFILRSDKSGWRNLYYYDLDGGLKAQLTDFDWRVKELTGVDEEDGWVYFEGTGETSTDNHIFRVKLNGSQWEQLSENAGSHKPDFSPAYEYFISEYNNINTPTRMAVYETDGRHVREIAARKAPDPEDEGVGKVELFTIATEDGFELPAYWVLPPDFDPEKKYGVIFTIYGGPNYRGVSNSYVNPKGNLYTRDGHIVFKVDHRGSGHFGKEGLNYLHRTLGSWELNDYIEAVKWLKQQAFIDSTKIGITGGSYGGYMSILALTRGHEYFTHGFGQSAVTDWRLYDNVYTERYMDRPQDNPEGYDTTSTLKYAGQLEGELFITHGTMDDNVHMQNMIQLVDRLTDLNKDFEMMIYPKGRHGWGVPKIYHTIREMREFWNGHYKGDE
ncbi:MAG: S9 family peptidase [Bacteroidales bacterium]|nr:S9 family peptidase [Bacteroidales bacterium]MCF8344424.1 S9 family peptidase [Bacteroidales bacterium]MCF8351203.1 S9 family peptidase [Bacteroidales bacterium]MCF8377656.1 S9 family peptidase [Bacteroidales bacterium]MCF8402056.1 S9 family peptidase [Bacteroidales bacterium]